MVLEVLSALSFSLTKAREAAALAWGSMRAVYPRGYGAGYSHLGGVFESLRR